MLSFQNGNLVYRDFGEKEQVDLFLKNVSGQRLCLYEKGMKTGGGIYKEGNFLYAGMPGYLVINDTDNVVSEVQYISKKVFERNFKNLWTLIIA